jgi:serine/threonine protein kinase
MPISLVHTHAVDGRQTRYLLRDTADGSIWWGCSTEPVSEIKSTPVEKLPRSGVLDPDAFFTKLTTNMTRYHGALDSPSIFIKHHNFIRYDSFEDKTVQPGLRATQEREIWAAQKYQSAPHPNVCEYMGVVTDVKERVIATVYRRFDMDLWTLIENTNFLKQLASQPASARPQLPTLHYIMSAIKSGMNHIHSLGLVHCDIRPANIFIDTDTYQVVIGDFDGTNTPGNLLCGRFAMKAAEHAKGRVVDVGIDVGLVEDIEAWLEECKKRKLA